MDAISQTFAALADPTRRAILARLAQGEVHVGELARPFHVSAPAISRHLRVLERARLIERKTSAQWRVCRINGTGLRAAHDWLAPYREYWEQSLDRLAELLEEAEPPKPPEAQAKTHAPPAVKRRQPRKHP